MSLPDPPGRSVFGLDQNLVGALAYLLGPVSGPLLLVVETENRYVRFHAFQSLFMVIAVAVVTLMLAGVPIVGRFVVPMFVIAVTVLWFFLMYKALGGERYKLPFLGDWAEQQLR